MSKSVDTAMVLAAGYGKRMRPLTDATPKPLLPVLGRSLIDRILDRLIEVGVRRIVVNLHHHAELLADHLTARQDEQHGCELILLREPELLDTGGGLAAALPQLGAGPFFAINGDSLWLDGLRPALGRLSANWDEAEMDALMLLQPTVTALGFSEGQGDFAMDAGGRLSRPTERRVVPFAFTGVQLMSPRLFAEQPDTAAFPLGPLWDRAIDAGRLFGLRHDGIWYHVGTPEALSDTEKELREHGFGLEVAAAP